MRAILIALVLAPTCYAQETPAEQEARRLLVELGKPLDPKDFTGAPERARSLLISELARIGPEARAAIPKLLELANQENAGAAAALVQMKDDGFEAVLSLLRSDSQKIRTTIVTVLRGQLPAELYDEVYAIAKKRKTFSYPHMVLLACPENRDRTTRLLMDCLEQFDLGDDGAINPILVLEAIGRLGHDARLATRRLRIIADEHESGTICLQAAAALTKVTPDGKFSIPILKRLLSEDQGDLSRQTSLGALSALAVHPLRHTLQPELLIQAMEHRPEIAPGLPMETPLATFGHTTIWFLIGELEAESATDLLRDQFAKYVETKPEAAVFIAAALARRGVAEDKHIEFLIKQLQNTNLTTSANRKTREPAVRATAAYGLGFVTTASKQVLDALRAAMQHRSETEAGVMAYSDMAIEAAWSIAKLDPEDSTFAEVVKTRPISYFHRREPKHRTSPEELAKLVRSRISHLLPALYAEAFPSFLDLIKLVARPDSSYAHDILIATGGEPLQELVRRAFELIAKDPPDPRSGPARRLLHKECDRLGSEFDLFAEHCKSDNVRARQLAVHGLGVLKLRPNESVPLLIASCRDKRAIVRAEAAQALAKFGDAADPALPALKEMLDDSYLTASNAAKKALASLEK